MPLDTPSYSLGRRACAARGSTRSALHPLRDSGIGTRIVGRLDCCHLLKDTVRFAESAYACFAIFIAFRKHLGWIQAKQIVECFIGVPAAVGPRQGESSIRARRQRAERLTLSGVVGKLVHFVRDRVVEEPRHVATNEIDRRHPAYFRSVRLPKSTKELATALFRRVWVGCHSLGMLRLSKVRPAELVRGSQNRLASVGVDDVPVAGATAWYLVSMSPEVAQLGAFAGDDEHCRS